MKNVLSILLCLVLFSGFAFSNPSTVKKKYPTEIVLSESNTVYITSYVGPKSTSNVMKLAMDLDAKMMPGAPLYFVLDTGGGSISYGLEMIDFLSSLKRPVHTITLWAASMGFHTVQGLGDRYIVRDGTLMSHKAWGAFWGEFPGQVDNRYKLWLDRVKEMDKRVVSRTEGKYTNESYFKLIENEYWCHGQQCVDDKFADAVVDARCDASFLGTKDLVWYRFFVPKNKSYGSDSDFSFHVIEFVDLLAKCPLITGYLNWTIKIDGVPLFSFSPSEINDSYVDSIHTGNEILDWKVKNLLRDRIKSYKSQQSHRVTSEL